MKQALMNFDKSALLRIIDRFTSPHQHTRKDDLRYWQERLVMSILLASLFLGLLAIVPSVRLCIKEGLWGVAAFDIAIYIMILCFFFIRRIPFVVRAYALIFGAYILGLVLLTVVGPSASGPVWLFAFPVLAGVMIGAQASVTALVLNILTLIAIGILIATGYPAWLDPEPHTVERWIVISLNFILLNAVATLSLTMILKGLQAAFAEEKRIRLELEKEIAERKKREEAARQLNERLQRAQKMEAIGTFASGIAHDFNNILYVMTGYSELAIDESSENANVRAYLSEVLTAGKRAKELIRQILTFSRETDSQRQPVQVSLIVKESLKLIRSLMPANIAIKETIDSKYAINGNPTHIHQILMNLCVNAEHAMERSGGVLEIQLIDLVPDNAFLQNNPESAADHFVHLKVADTGHGMPPETLNRIFDPFYTTKERGKGTGMGLSVVHGIIKEYGGIIDVSSKPGKGTVFNIYLPALTIGAAADEDRIIHDLPKGSGRILAIDDEPSIADMNRKMLETLGYEVSISASSKDALDLFSGNPDRYDLVITDMTMPDLTGDRLAVEIKKMRPDIPIILCTGFSEVIDEETAREMGIDDFLMKPVSRKKLAEKVHFHLRPPS